ncbi:MAG: T9SS type A sorting domain-containing protein, partial [Bacteroidota bacterium]
TVDDGSCEFFEETFGCTNPDAFNYNPEANIDDGSCAFDACSNNEPVEICYQNNSNYYLSFVNSQNGALMLNVINGEVENNFDLFNVYGEDGDLLFSGEGDLTGTVVVAETGSLTVEIISDGSVSCESGSFEPILLTVECIDGVAEGCTDPEALNYDENALVDDGSCEYEVEECDEGLNGISVFVATQYWGNEISWTLSDADGNVVAEGGEYDSQSEYLQNLCLADGCYTLDLQDSWGDGWNGGYYMIYGNGQMYAEGTLLYGSSSIEIISINSDCEIAGCMDPEAINYSPDATVDDGNCVYNNFWGDVNPEDYFGVEIGMTYGPNPIIDEITVNITGLNDQIPLDLKVMNMMGQLVYEAKIDEHSKQVITQINAADWSAGNYFVTVIQGDQILSETLIKQ